MKNVFGINSLFFIYIGTVGEYFLSERNTNSSSEGSSIDAFHAQLQRILESATFREAPVSRRLLKYLHENSLYLESGRLKEYTIGIEVLGRKPDFDPKTDTIVRVQIHRVRQKIKQYYDTEGKNDDVMVIIPKGRYSVEFTTLEHKDRNNNFQFEPTFLSEKDRPADVLSISAEESKALIASPTIVSQPLPITRPTINMTRWKLLTWIGIAVLLGCALGNIYSNLWHKFHQETAVEIFWRAVLEGDPSPIIGYSDAIFLTDRFSNLFQFKGGAVSSRGELVDPHLVSKYTLNSELVASAGPLFYEDSYTGTGELKGTVLLATLLKELKFDPQVMPSQDILTDSLRTHNIILLGGPAENLAAQQFIVPGDFEYQFRGEAWGATILSKHPHAGEASQYQIERDPTNQAVRSTYGLISCQPTVNHSRLIVLGGLDTAGTLGAAEYSTSKAGAEVLYRAFKQSPHFQVVIHTTIKNGSSIYRNEAVAIHSGLR